LRFAAQHFFQQFIAPIFGQRRRPWKKGIVAVKSAAPAAKIVDLTA
jgi:hypothetical protein